jgi:hypothetical protein
MNIDKVRADWQTVHLAAQKRGTRAANSVLVRMTHCALPEPVEVVWTAFEWECKVKRETIGSTVLAEKGYRFDVLDGRTLWRQLRNSQEGLR